VSGRIAGRGGDRGVRALEKALASDEVWCLNVVLDPAAYRKTGQVSLAI
jgi:hypothetical protein